MRKAEIDRTIRKAIGYIAGEQLSDGGFRSFSSPVFEPFKAKLAYRTTFAPSLMLAALAGEKSAAAATVTRRLALFVKSQAGPTGAYNYWAKRSPERKRRPYPDDLDDTFCALSALYLHDPANIDEGTLAASVRLLLATEASVGGPYRTWLVSREMDEAWQDIDPAVNANIAYYLSLVSNPLPKLQAYLDSLIVKNDLTSPYYPSSYPLIYYLSRGYGGIQKDKLEKKIRILLAEACSAQDTALCLSALYHLKRIKSEDEQHFKSLLSAQEKDGSWPAAAFCSDPAIDGDPYYGGSPTLATAFAIEALNGFKKQNAQPREAAGRRAHDPSQKAVMDLAEKDCRELPADLRNPAFQALQTIASGSNGDEIIGLAPRFYGSLAEPPSELPAHFLESLSLANLYGWLAYTVYDDFIDEEGTPPLLPVANAAMRRSVSIFSEAVPSNIPFRRYVLEIFDTIDSANAWELAQCRFIRKSDMIYVDVMPDFQDLAKLAERSLGHCLAPLAVLAAAGHETSSPAFLETRRAFSHYLIAKQLSDDLHDWQTDLAHGHITYVVVRILQGLCMVPGKHRLKPMLEKAQPKFWHDVLPAICAEMRRHIALGREAARSASVFGDDNLLLQLLGKMDLTVTETLKKQSEAENFLQHYGRKGAKL